MIASNRVIGSLILVCIGFLLTWLINKLVSFVFDVAGGYAVYALAFMACWAFVYFNFKAVNK